MTPSDPTSPYPDPSPAGRWRGLALALTLGTAGGAIFWLLTLPLAWMLGAMAATTTAALAGLRPTVPHGLRVGMLAVLGVMLGSNFSPAMLAHVAAWGPSLAGLFVFTLATPFVASLVFRRFGGLDPVTAYYAAAPGGINEMVAIGGAAGGDERVIALVHALRILIVVFTVPVWFRLTGAVPSGGGGLVGPSLFEPGEVWGDFAMLAVCAVAGLPVGALLRLPAARLTGPMVLSAAVHLAGLTTLRPPIELVALAQVVIGSALGARFIGLKARSLGPTVLQAVVSSAVMLALAAAIAAVVAWATGVPFVLLLLAYVPGGVAEMSLVALALGMEVAFVATHHTARIALVIAVAPAAFRRLRRRPEPPLE